MRIPLKRLFVGILLWITQRIYPGEYVFKKPYDDDEDHYYEVRLLPAQRKALLGLIQEKTITARMLNEIKNAVLAAVRYDLQPAEVLWEEYEDKAAKRGGSLADWIWDAPWRD